MDSATLAALRVELAALAIRTDGALRTLDRLIAAADRRCADCHRRSDDLAQCGDGQWRGPTCRKRWELGVGVQLAVGDGQPVCPTCGLPAWDADNLTPGALVCTCNPDDWPDDDAGHGDSWVHVETVTVKAGLL